MDKITALNNTLIKKYPKDSTELNPEDYAPMPKGKFYLVEKWEEAENDHIKAVLSHGAGTRFFFDPHCYFPPTDDIRGIDAPYNPESKYLTQADFEAAAELLNCSVAAVKAVTKIESGGSGFFRNGLTKILFEAHWFSNFTNDRFNYSHPNISSNYWNRKLYYGGVREYERLNLAKTLNKNGAIKSASYGLFQVMGFHYKLCGFKTPQDYYDAQQRNEWEHLKAAMAFIKSKKLDRHMRSLNWAAFAYGYNGSGYRKNRYDTKLAKAYASFS